MIYVISGPSGSGKTTLIREVLSRVPGLRFSVSHTTRPKRAGEMDGRDYHFVNEKVFQRMVRRGEFIEWAVVHNFYYGTAARELRQAGRNDLVLDIDVQGAAQVKRKVRGAVFVFILPPNYQELKARLKKRGLDDPAVVRRRLERARQEIRSYHRFDYLVINDDLKEATRELESIIRCHRCRRLSRERRVAAILKSFGIKSPQG